MKHKAFGWTIANVVVYLVGALVLFTWLTIRASNGGFFSSASGTYKVVVPSAPGVEGNKTNVLSPSGVRVGVVTSVELVPDGAALELKVTEPLVVREDASAKVVISNVIGEKAVVLDAGSADASRAADGQTIESAQGTTIVNPDAALEPMRALQDLRENPELRTILDEQQVNVDAINTDVASMNEDLTVLRNVLGAQSVALGNISGRTSVLVADLAAHGGQIEDSVAQAAALAGEVNTLLDGELDVLDRMLSFSATALEIVAAHQDEIDYVVSRLPDLAFMAQETSDELVHLLRNEYGHFVYIGATNLVDLERFLRILNGGTS